MCSSLPCNQTIKMYHEISIRLTDPSLLQRLRALLGEKQTLTELLDWVHSKLKFDKGDIIRHSEPFEILKYGQGKCREFSVLYTAICLASGYRARLILDMSDHVWTEVWDPTHRIWVHVDPSERRVNDPLMYERDWKKKLQEIYAFEGDQIIDVTGKYKLPE